MNVASFIALAIFFLVPLSFGDTIQAMHARDQARAEYWHAKGYDFDPEIYTARAMDIQVRDIERAKYWKQKGHSFDPSIYSAEKMDTEALRREKQALDTSRKILRSNSPTTSGASKSTGLLSADLRADGYNQKLTITRPPNAPGYEKDLAFAQQLLQSRLQQRQVQVAERAAAAQQSAAIWQMVNTINQQTQRNTSPHTVYTPAYQAPVLSGDQYDPNSLADPYRSLERNKANTVNTTYGKTGYQHGWKVYEKPQPGYSYGGTEVNPYGPGGSKSYGPGGGKSYGQGGGKSYGSGGANSYGTGGGKNPLNPWEVAE
jgi:hypothetical protein